MHKTCRFITINNNGETFLLTLVHMINVCEHGYVIKPLSINFISVGNNLTIRLELLSVKLIKLNLPVPYT